MMWKNIVDPERPQMKIRCMRISRWIPKAKNKHSEHVTLILFYCSNNCTNAPQCDVICRPPLLLTWL